MEDAHVVLLALMLADSVLLLHEQPQWHLNHEHRRISLLQLPSISLSRAKVALQQGLDPGSLPVLSFPYTDGQAKVSMEEKFLQEKCGEEEGRVYGFHNKPERPTDLNLGANLGIVASRC